MKLGDKFAKQSSDHVSRFKALKPFCRTRILNGCDGEVVSKKYKKATNKMLFLFSFLHPSVQSMSIRHKVTFSPVLHEFTAAMTNAIPLFQSKMSTLHAVHVPSLVSSFVSTTVQYDYRNRVWLD